MKSLTLVFFSAILFVSTSFSEGSSFEKAANFLYRELHGFTPKNSSEVVKEILDSAPKPIAPVLTVEEIAAIHGYTKWFYVPINRMLREGRKDLDSVGPYLHRMNSAIERLPVFTGLVVRWVWLAEKDLAQFEQPVVLFDGYTSSSRNLEYQLDVPHTVDVAEPRRLVKLIINSQSGRDISFYSINPSEQEVLFSAGSRFRVLSRVQNRHFYEIHLAEVEK